MVSGRQIESGSGPIRLGMVGGGQGAFIGGVHRIAARMDGEFVLVAGALSSEPARAKASAAEIGRQAVEFEARYEAGEIVGMGADIAGSAAGAGLFRVDAP